MLKSVVALSVLVSLAGGFSQSVFAQSQKTGASQQWNAKERGPQVSKPKPKLTGLKQLTAPPPNFEGPIYRTNASFVGGQQTSSTIGHATYLRLKTKDDLGTVKAWYEQELRTGGWRITSQRQSSMAKTPVTQVTAFNDSQGMVCNVSLMPMKTGETDIGVTVTMTQ